ncbi:MAG: hypothetical protein JXA09_06710 [Anaerolineae bacterium]|nr:hypothetical protein [Anaerolineae bacterium]
MAYNEMQPELYWRMEQMRRAEMRRDADRWRLLGGARGAQPRLPRGGCWLLDCLGRWLVEAGEQLQRYGRYEGRTLEA